MRRKARELLEWGPWRFEDYCNRRHAHRVTVDQFYRMIRERRRRGKCVGPLAPSMLDSNYRQRQRNRVKRK